MIAFKRSMNTGYAGVQNPLFFKDNTQMLEMQRIADAIMKTNLQPTITKPAVLLA